MSIKLSAVTVRLMRSTFFVTNFSIESLPKSLDRAELLIDDDVQLVAPPDLYAWPAGTPAPEPAILCQAVDNSKYYRVFKRSSDVQAEFTPTGMAYGGISSESFWEQFAEELPRTLDFYRIPDMDPPGAMDEVLQSLRGAN